MATPDIGTTISDGYSRGLDRAGALVGAAILPAAVMGAIAFATGVLQAQLRPDSIDDVMAAFLSANFEGASFGERAGINVLGAIESIALVFLSSALAAVLAGALHRERHGAALELPSPGASLGATLEMIPRLMPKLGLLALLGVAGTLVSIFSGVLGGLVSVVAGMASIWLSIRWVYADVIAGSGEAVRDAAYERSDQTVSGSWWGTFGVWLVVGLAVFVPVLIAAAIVGAILGSISVYLGALGLFATLLLLGAVLWPTALESAWSQVEATHAVSDDHAHGVAAPDVTYPTAAPGTGQLPGAAGPDVVGEDDRQRGPFV